MGLELHETRRGAVLAADLDVQSTIAIVVEVHGTKIFGLDAEFRDVLRDGDQVERSVRSMRLRCLASSAYQELRGV